MDLMMKETTDHSVFSTSHLNPVALSERIRSIDVIRGVALLGILVINIELFSNPYEKIFNPLLSADFTGWNYYLWLLKEIVFSSKMWTLFSILFGAGAYLLITRAEEKGNAAGIADIYYRRLFWLLLIALIHAYLIWSGDILFFYAITGLFLYPLRKLSVRGMIIASLLLLLITLFLSYREYSANVSLHKQVTKIEASQKSGKEITEEQQAILKEWDSKNIMNNPDIKALHEKIETMSSGTYFEIVKSEKEWVRDGHTALFYPRLFLLHLMMMILGMALMKAKVLSAELKKKTYFMLMIFGYAIGFSLSALRIQDLLHHEFDVLTIGGMINKIERIAVALGHIGLIALFCKSNILGCLKRALASVGRMAFTNYIVQSLICTFLFYGYGFGLYGTMNRMQQMVVVISIWVFQLIFSPVWLKYFRFGPLEWVWRSLTYWKRQPMIAGK